MVALIFDPVTGIRAPTTAEIREAIATSWRNAFADPDLPALDTDPTTPAGQLIDAEVAEVEAKNSQVLYLANMFNPRVAEGRWQDAQGYLYFLNRKLDEPTVTTCQITGLSGTVIKYGSIVQSDDGHNLICNSPVTIPATGVTETTFRCVDTGPIDIPPGSVNTIVTTLPGWDTVANADAGSVGRDIETRADFAARIAESVAANAHGSVAALYGALNNISGTEGVLDVQVLENLGPDPIILYGVTVPGHGVTICIYGGADEDIARTIYNKKDAGCDTGGNTTITYSGAGSVSGAVRTYKILRPTPVNFWVRVTLGASPLLTTEVQEQIKFAVYQDFLGENDHTQNPRVGLAQDVYASRFNHAVAAVDNVSTLRNVEIALSEDMPTDYVLYMSIRGDQEPVISLSNITIVIQ